jgi:hypothetical protein
MELTFKHSGNAGDIIYALASVKHICEKQNTKAIIYLHLNQSSSFNHHVTGDVMLNQKMYDMIKLLLEYQDYIEKVEPYAGQIIDYNLDAFRNNKVNLSAGNIATWYSFPYPELNPDLSQAWLTAPKVNQILPVANRTERYVNPLIMYDLIGKCDFIGVDREYKIISQYTSNFNHLKVMDFLEMAAVINSSPLFLGNQSLAFAIAEGLKVKRILESFYNAPNVIPQGGEWYQFNDQKQLKKILELVNTTNQTA